MHIFQLYDVLSLTLL